MKNSLFKKLIAVSLAFATLMFAGCQKDEPVNNESPSENISQEVDENGLSNKLPVMDNTIDLSTIDLNAEFNIYKDYEISVPYPTALGTVYVVREFLTEKTLTYLFITTQDDIKYEMISDYGLGSTIYTIFTENVDSEFGEEILIAIDVGSTFGRGLWMTGVYKITENGFERIEMDESGYSFTTEKPFKFVITNKYTDLKETVDADKQSYKFEEDGTPTTDSTEYISLGAWDIRPEDVDNDGDFEVVVKEWCDISKETTDKNIDTTTTYEYDKENNKFVVIDTDIMITGEGEEVYEDGYRYAYCDINNDGTDELITWKSIKTNNPAFMYENEHRVFVLEDERIVYAGELEEDQAFYRGGLYCVNGHLVEATVRTSKIWYKAYKLENNKIIKVDSGENISLEYEDELYERIGDSIEWYCY